MRDSTIVCRRTDASARCNQAGFTVAEFMISALILLAVTSALFTMLSDIQRTASYQTEVHAVLNNAQTAIQTIERYIRQAGNDPHGIGVPGITIVSSTVLKIQSDLTGSSGANTDKGDPDGDTNDSGENVTIRFNDQARTLEVVPDGGPAQIIAGNISGLTFQYYDAAGGVTTLGSEVRRIAVTVSGSSLLPDPRTHQIFGIRLSSEIRIMT